MKKRLQTIWFGLRGLIAVLVPAVLGILILLLVGLVTGNRRKGLNAMTRVIGWLGCWLGGIRLRVNGPERLRQPRPAVYIFNHRSSVDPVILCRLLDRDVVAVAKIELRDHLVVGPLLRLGETIFVNRGAGSGSVAQALQQLRRQRCLVIAPEGTRSRDVLLRPFRLGAFRIAMQAGLPVIPIVVHGADRVARPGSLVMRGATLQVDVLAPMPSQHWQESQLPEVAEQTHQLMLERLQHGSDQSK